MIMHQQIKGNSDIYTHFPLQPILKSYANLMKKCIARGQKLLRVARGCHGCLGYPFGKPGDTEKARGVTFAMAGGCFFAEKAE